MIYVFFYDIHQSNDNTMKIYIIGDQNIGKHLLSVNMLIIKSLNTVRQQLNLVRIIKSCALMITALKYFYGRYLSTENKSIHFMKYENVDKNCDNVNTAIEYILYSSITQ